MGAKTWMLVYSDGDPKERLLAKPLLDRERTASIARQLFPNEHLQALEDGCLSSTNPPYNELVIGCFPGLCIAAADEFGLLDFPSHLPVHFIQAAPHPQIYLHAMHSVVDWFAFAIWRDGKLQRSLSLAPDRGIIEDIGTKLAFEEPYWAGKHRPKRYPLPFHPLDLGEAALGELFGYHLEGVQTALDTEEFPLMTFCRQR